MGMFDSLKDKLNIFKKKAAEEIEEEEKEAAKKAQVAPGPEKPAPKPVEILPDVQDALVDILGLAILSFAVIKPGQIIEHRDDVRMVGPAGPFVDVNGPKEKALG